MTYLAARLQTFEVARDFSSDRQAAIAVLLAATLGAAIPAFVLPVPGLWFIAALGAASIIFLEPRLGLYTLCVAAGIDAAPLDPLTSPLGKIFATLPAVNLTPVELLALWTALTAIVKGCLERNLRFPPPLLLAAIGVFLLLLLLAVLQGLSRGGDLTIALWEVRALVSIGPVMLATTQLVRDRKDVLRLGLVFAAVLFLMTLETFWRYTTYVRPGVYEGALEFAYSHETSVLVGLLMSSCAAWALWGPNRKERILALAVGVLAAVVLLTMRRRAGLIAGEAGLLTIGLFLLLKDRRRFLVIAPIALVLSTVYLGAFWNNPNSLGQPARAFRTVFDADSTDGRDQASDAYRKAEKLNVWWNIRAAPLEGIGFGVAYAKPFPFPDLSSFWPFWDFIPHNTILWLWMKAGILGFMSFWFLLGSGMTRVVEICKTTADPLVIAACSSIAAFFTMVVLFSYVDLGLTNTRLMIVFGISLGLIGTLQSLVSVERSGLALTGAHK